MHRYGSMDCSDPCMNLSPIQQQTIQPPTELLYHSEPPPGKLVQHHKLDDSWGPNTRPSTVVLIIQRDSEWTISSHFGFMIYCIQPITITSYSPNIFLFKVSRGHLSERGGHVLHHPSVNAASIWGHHVSRHVQRAPSHPPWCWGPLLHRSGWSIFWVSSAVCELFPGCF